MNTTTDETLVRDVVACCKAMKAALKARTGKTWSVTRGRGTACGWITITAPAARLVCGHMTTEECSELANTLGMSAAHDQGVSVPASYDHRQEFLDRCRGVLPSVIGQQYWD